MPISKVGCRLALEGYGGSARVLVEVIMAWLLCRGEVLASIEVVHSPLKRARGMIGREPHDAALYCSPARIVHTIGVQFPIDAAFLDEDLVVVRTTSLVPYRVGMPTPRAHSVLQAEKGAFARWSLKLGDRLEIRD